MLNFGRVKQSESEQAGNNLIYTICLSSEILPYPMHPAFPHVSLEPNSNGVFHQMGQVTCTMERSM